tara:strand:+ start:307 stop:654 length:348 start_codon:yes stop_codon:yes gene_type:complete
MADVNVVFGGYNSITQGYNEGGYESDIAFTGLTSALGSVTTIGAINIDVTGVSGSATVGNTTETAGGGISLGVTGTVGTSALSSVSIWSEIDPSQTPNYQEVSTTQTPNWIDIAA